MYSLGHADSLRLRVSAGLDRHSHFSRLLSPSDSTKAVTFPHPHLAPPFFLSSRSHGRCRPVLVYIRLTVPRSPFEPLVLCPLARSFTNPPAPTNPNNHTRDNLSVNVIHGVRIVGSLRLSLLSNRRKRGITKHGIDRGAFFPRIPFPRPRHHGRRDGVRLCQCQHGFPRPDPTRHAFRLRCWG